MTSTQTLADRMQVSAAPSRLFMFFLAGHSAYLADTPGALIQRVFGEAGQAWFVVALIALIGTIDTIINDVLPEKYRFKSGLAIRHWMLMGCAWFFASGAFLAVRDEATWAAMPYFVACAINMSAHAFFDIRRRFKRA